MIIYENSNMDLKTFKRSDMYFNLLKDVPISMWGYMCRGIPIEIDGDLMKISIYSIDKIILSVRYDVYTDSEVIANITYNSSDTVKFIRNNLLPKTRLRVKATFTDKPEIYNGGEILFYNKSLLYGYYICPKCGHVYGIEKSCADKLCEMCEEEGVKLRYVTNFYDCKETV